MLKHMTTDEIEREIWQVVMHLRRYPETPTRPADERRIAYMKQFLARRAAGDDPEGRRLAAAMARNLRKTDWEAIRMDRTMFGPRGRPTIMTTRQRWHDTPPRTYVTYTKLGVRKGTPACRPTPLDDFDF